MTAITFKDRERSRSAEEKLVCLSPVLGFNTKLMHFKASLIVKQKHRNRVKTQSSLLFCSNNASLYNFLVFYNVSKVQKTFTEKKVQKY